MKKFIKRSLVVFLIGFFFCIPVMAKGHNGFHVGDDLSLTKKITSTLFSAGNNVDVSSEVDGASFIAGNNLTLSSKQDILFAAGNSISIKDLETKDAFVAGSKIEVENSKIRDLYATAQTIRIDSDISRNAYLGGETITINGTIDGDCYISAESIRIGKEASITGTLKYPEESKISISESASIGKTETYKASDEKRKETIQEKISSLFLSFLMILITGIIFLAVAPKVFKKLEKMEFESPVVIKNIFFGFLLLIGLPISVIIALISVIGIPIALIALAIYLIAIYLTSITTSYYLGYHLLKDKIKNNYLLLTLSLLILFLVRLIPFIGGLISFLSICLGLGLFLEVLKSARK